MAVLHTAVKCRMQSGPELCVDAPEGDTHRHVRAASKVEAPGV